jgi:tetratricopeptide (TPR) repeat protein
MLKKNFLPIGFCALVIVALLCIYIPGLQNGLVFDDNSLTNGAIMEHYGSLLKLQQRMLSYGSFVWVQDLFGDGWWKQRLVNLGLHMGVVAALFGFFRTLLAHTHFPEGFEAQPRFHASRTAALCVGVALFALNPMAVYAVNYLVERSIVMATLFTVLTLWAFSQGLITRRWPWFVAALLAYLVAVLSKENALMAVALTVPLYAYLHRPSWKRLAAVLIVALVLLGIVVAGLLQVYGSILGVSFDTTSLIFQQQLEQLRPGIGHSIYPLSILNQTWLFFKYGLLWVLPNPLWMSIDLRPPFPLSFTAFPQILGAIGYPVLLGFASWVALRRRDVLGYVGLLLLMPALLFWTEFATVWVQDPFVLYRSYLWAIALPGLLALVLTGLPPKLIYTAGIVVGALFAGIALDRVWSLQDPQTAWTDAVDHLDLKAPANAVGRWRPYLNRGAYNLDRGEPVVAYPDFVAADQLGELKGSARFDMGVALQQQKKNAEALEAFSSAAALGKDDFELHYQRGEAYYAVGKFKEAYADFSAALKKPPAVAASELQRVLDAVRLRRAEAAIYLQDFDAAIADFNELLKRQPNSERILVGLGMSEVGKKEIPAAMKIFNRLIAAKPSVQAYYGRALAHIYAGDKPAALADLDLALKIDPRSPQANGLRQQITGSK